MDAQNEKFGEDTDQLRRKPLGISPIFGLELRDKEKPLPPGFDPGYFEDAIKNPEINCFPISGRQEGYCSHGFRPTEQISDELAVLSPVDSEISEIETLPVQGVEYLPMEPVNAPAWPTPTSFFYQGNYYFPTVNMRMVQMPSELPDKSTSAECNYIVTPIRKLVYLDRSGKEIKEREAFDCEIIISGHGSEFFTICTKDIRRLTTIIADRFSYAEVNQNVKKAEKIIERRFRNATKSLPVQYIYCEAGWVGSDDQFVYGFDGLN